MIKKTKLGNFFQFFFFFNLLREITISLSYIKIEIHLLILLKDKN